jgi:hypothetical protein
MKNNDLPSPTPGRANFNPRAFIWTNLVDTHKKIFHAKHLSCSSLGFLKEDFLSFYNIHIGKINDPRGGANFDPRAFIWTNLVDTH